MRLSDFIVQNVDRIVDEWERFAATLTPARLVELFVNVAMPVKLPAVSSN